MKFRLFFLCLLSLSTGSTAFGQGAVLPSIRIDAPGVSQVATAGGYSSASNMLMEHAEDSDDDFDSDINIASASAGTGAGVTGISTGSSSLATGMCLSAIGVSSYVAAVDCTMNLVAGAFGNNMFGFGQAQSWGSCGGQGLFMVQARTLSNGTVVTAGNLVAHVHLLLTGTTQGDAGIQIFNLGASAPGVNVDVMGFGSGMYIGGSYVDLSGTTQTIDEYAPTNAGLNNYYSGFTPTVAGAINRLDSYIDCPYHYGAYAYTDGNMASGALYGLSAHADYAIFP